MNKLLILFLLYFSLLNAAIANSVNCTIFDRASDIPLKYAKLFSLKEDKKNKVIFVGIKAKEQNADFEWWGLSENVDKLKKYLSTCPQFKLMPFPKRAISTSTTHMSFVSDIEAYDNIKGFTQVQMISNQVWKKRIGKNLLNDLPLTLNIEHFIAGNYDLLLTYPESNFDNLISKLNGKSKNQKVHLIPIIEYLENKALGRLEWIKFFGAIFNKRDKAWSVFTEREKLYLDVVHKIGLIGKRKTPRVLMGEMLGNKWVYPSSKSDFVDLCNDLKIDVVRPHLGSNMGADLRKNIGPDFFHLEEILTIKDQVDYWLLNSAYFTKRELLQKRPIYREFSGKKIITLLKSANNQSNYHPYWESGVNHPDQLILDLASLFYPENFAKHRGLWFNELL